MQYLPTKIIFGKGVVESGFDLFKQYGKKALIVTGRNSSKKNGSLEDIIKALDKNKITYSVFDEVESNPSVETVQRGGGLAIKEKADFIIGVGGGSPLDAAKVIALLTKNKANDENFFQTEWKEDPLPMIAVPTTAGTGSEVTPYAILTNPGIESKSSIVSEKIFPAVAFLDASYTQTLLREITLNTALDALSHSVEGFLSTRASDFTNLTALESIRILGEIFPFFLESKDIPFQMREKLLYASLLGGMVIAQTGTTALHAMGYSLTYFKNIDHGRANGLLMAEYLDFLKSRKVNQVDLALKTFGVATIQEFKAFFEHLLGVKEKITEKESLYYAKITLKTRNMNFTLKTMGEKELSEIYLNSLK
ncbi:MAG TPA: alcohol dehydrogenase [Spirochaetia bacterium]|nr:alcohol dehydrogenase [Spirochaetia bacterium]